MQKKLGLSSNFKYPNGLVSLSAALAFLVSGLPSYTRADDTPTGATEIAIVHGEETGSVRLEWYGQNAINYALESHCDLTWLNRHGVTFHLSHEQNRYFRATTDTRARFFRLSGRASPGIMVADEGAHTGKLVYYREDGTVAPLRAFGVNYYDAFMRYISDVNDTSFIEGFAWLQAHYIPIARVLGAAFWPREWGLYFNDPEEYFRRMDFFIEQAESHGVGLIICLFWATNALGEIVEQAVQSGALTPGQDFTPADPLHLDVHGVPTHAEYSTAMGRMDSGSIAMIRRYTRDIVERYGHSPAIWGWEFGNEYNLAVDHPNINAMRSRSGGHSVQHMMLPETTTDTNVLPRWTGPDDLKREHVELAKTVFAETVREIDTWRFISSGDSRPRPQAYHNWTQHTWSPDSRDQNWQVMPVDNPEPMDTVTVHLYPGGPDSGTTTYFPEEPIVIEWLHGQYRELLEYYKERAASFGRPLIVGEWGAIGTGETEDERQTFHRFLQALIDAEVQLSLVWTFDTRNIAFAADWYIHTGDSPDWPATPKLYQLANDDPNLWDLRQANELYGAFPSLEIPHLP